MTDLITVKMPLPVVVDDSLCDGNNPNNRYPMLQAALIADDLQTVLMRAHQLGMVITVELENFEPLAMGNYRMVGKMRSAR